MRLFRRRDAADPVSRQVSDPTTVGAQVSTPVEMTGTTTIGAENLARLFISRRRSSGGLLEMLGELIAEPNNPVDPDAVAVHVEGELVGYLPGYIANHEAYRGLADECRVQLWGTATPDGLRVRGWVALGRDEVAWPHDASNPPAVTVEERRAEQAADTSRMVTEALAGGGARAAQFQQGMQQGYHYLEAIEPIKQLKREGRLEEALTLCYGAIAGAERDSGGREPAPWYTEQAAIIHRKLGQRGEEEAVLRRWLKRCPPERRAGSRIADRLDRMASK